MTSFFKKPNFLLSSLQSLSLFNSAAHLSVTSTGTSPNSMSVKKDKYINAEIKLIVGIVCVFVTLCYICGICTVLVYHPVNGKYNNSVKELKIETFFKVQGQE